MKNNTSLIDRKKNNYTNLKTIEQTCKDVCTFSGEKSCSLKGDSLQLLKRLPDHCISLILTDPPYHSTKKNNIFGDTFFREDSEYLNWIKEYAKEWYRILKPNGSVYCFCSPVMSAKLEAVFSEKFNILSQIVWTKPNAPGFDGWKQKMKKEALRQWYQHSERIIFMEPAVEGNLNRSYFGTVLKAARKEVNVSSNVLTEMIGAYGKVNHGGAISNWETGRNIPDREQYSKLQDAFSQLGIKNQLPEYEDAIRPFFVNKKIDFTDIWTFENIRPYKGKHPAEKPVKLLSQAILASTYENDIVLDCFAGSGSTAVAALKNNRLSISIEIDENWISQITNLLKKLEETPSANYPDNYIEPLLDLDSNSQLQLFNNHPE